MSTSSQTSKAVKISYTMSPPADLPLDASLAISKSHVFTIPSSASSLSSQTSSAVTSDSTPTSTTTHSTSDAVLQNQAEKAYYKSLLSALGEAKQTVGEELTSWRDVIGKREGVVMKREDEDEDEDGDGEE